MVFSRITRRVLRWRAEVPASSQPLSWAPHPIALYERILRELLYQSANAPFQVTPLSHVVAGLQPADTVRLVLRHDVDTLACVRQAGLLAEAEEGLGIHSDWYVRVDEYHYGCEDVRPVVDRLRHAGHRIGLHAAPYLHENPLAALEQAQRKFCDSFGFEPATWTIHGFAANDRLRARRRAFEETIEAHSDLRRQTDLSGRAYQRACGDAHFALDRSRTFFCQHDWNNLMAAQPGEAVLLLIHPCYWGRGGVSAPPPGP